jgi:hypothetical protein
MINEQFLNIGFGIKGSLPLQPWAAAILKQRTAENGKDDPTSRCLPGSPVQMHTSPFLRKMIQVPGLLVLMSENSAIYRQIFTDDRPLPDDPWPYWFGYSSGKWEGDTLVVHTIGFRDGLWLDRNGTPMTDAAKMTERFHRLNFGTLEIEVTIDDPKAYTAPFTVRIKQNAGLQLPRKRKRLAAHGRQVRTVGQAIVLCGLSFALRRLDLRPQPIPVALRL